MFLLNSHAINFNCSSDDFHRTSKFAFVKSVWLKFKFISAISIWKQQTDRTASTAIGKRQQEFFLINLSVHLQLIRGQHGVQAKGQCKFSLGSVKVSAVASTLLTFNTKQIFICEFRNFLNYRSTFSLLYRDFRIFQCWRMTTCYELLAVSPSTESLFGWCVKPVATCLSSLKFVPSTISSPFVEHLNSPVKSRCNRSDDSTWTPRSSSQTFSWSRKLSVWLLRCTKDSAQSSQSHWKTLKRCQDWIPKELLSVWTTSVMQSQWWDICWMAKFLSSASPELHGPWWVTWSKAVAAKRCRKRSRGLQIILMSRASCCHCSRMSSSIIWRCKWKLARNFCKFSSPALSICRRSSSSTSPCLISRRSEWSFKRSSTSRTSTWFQWRSSPKAPCTRSLKCPTSDTTSSDWIGRSTQRMLVVKLGPMLRFREISILRTCTRLKRSSATWPERWYRSSASSDTSPTWDTESHRWRPSRAWQHSWQTSTLDWTIKLVQSLQDLW